MIRPIFKVGPKERLLRSLMGLDPVRRWVPGLASWLHHPMSSIAREFTVDYHGFDYRGHTNNQIDWSVYFLKNFAVAETSLVESVGNFVRRRNQQFVCMDVGANVGHRTLPMAGLADEVIAIEPTRGAFERLTEKVLANGLSHVKTFQLALSDRTETIDVEILSPCNFVSVRKSDVLTCGAFGTETFSAMRGDEFMRAHCQQLPHFVRLDVRSETARVLDGLAETLRTARPVVLIARPPLPFGEAIDSEGLRSLLYKDAEIFTFNESIDDGTFSIDAFDSSAQKVVCIPAEIVRLACQEGCKNRSHRLKAGASIA